MRKISAALIGLGLVTGVCQAQDVYNPVGSFQIYPFGQFLTGDDIIHATGPGFGLGYNCCEHITLTLEGYVGDLDVKINGIHGVGTTYDGTLNVEYRFMTGRWSPYLVVGGGIFNYDAKDHDPHPILLNTSSTGVMYGGGLGIEYNLTKHWFLKAAYRGFGTTLHGIGFLSGPEVAAGYNF